MISPFLPPLKPSPVYLTRFASSRTEPLRFGGTTGARVPCWGLNTEPVRRSRCRVSEVCSTSHHLPPSNGRMGSFPPAPETGRTARPFFLRS